MCVPKATRGQAWGHMGALLLQALAAKEHPPAGATANLAYMGAHASSLHTPTPVPVPQAIQVSVAVYHVEQ